MGEPSRQKGTQERGGSAVPVGCTPDEMPPYRLPYFEPVNSSSIYFRQSPSFKGRYNWQNFKEGILFFNILGGDKSHLFKAGYYIIYANKIRLSRRPPPLKHTCTELSILFKTLHTLAARQQI